MDGSDCVSFRILGPLRVSDARGPVDVGGPKQRAVLALLLINANRPLAPDQLIEAIWGESSPASAKATLHAYISNLRRAIEPDRPPRAPGGILERNGGGYQLTVCPEHLDSLLFEKLLSQAGALVAADPERSRALLDEGLALWNGPALADFQYEDFAQAEITRLSELHVAARELSFECELGAGRGADLVSEIEKLVEAHPYREHLWAQLMVALYRAGRQAEALRVYRACEEVLANSGLVPAQPLRDLEQAILLHDPSLGGQRRGSPPPLRRPAAGLVGRAEELERARTILAETQSGAGSVVLVEGEAGIGKTRFVEAVESVATTLGFSTAFARCVEVGGAPPFWPWTQLTRKLGHREVIEAAGPHGPYLAPLLPGNDESILAAPLFRVAEGLAVSLRSLGERRPVLLVIDDLSSADPDSLSMLALVAAEVADAAVSILCTYRAHDLGSDHPLNATLAALSRLDHVHRLSLRRLGPDEVTQLIETLHGTGVDGETAAAIHEHSDGNPFFAVELAKLLVVEEGLTPADAATAVPATVRDVVGRRLAQLSSAAVSLIRAAAVIGREFELSVAAEALGIDIEEAVAAVEEAMAIGVVLEAEAAGRFLFSHMLVVNSVVKGLGSLRRAQLHQRIGDVLERRSHGDPGRWAELAHHRVGAIPLAGPEDAIEALARAGAHAFANTALESAQALFEQRLELVLSLAASRSRDELETAALFDLGRVWTWREGYQSPRLRAAARRLWDLTGISSGNVAFDPARSVDHTHPVLAAFQAQFSVDIVSGNINAAVAVTERLLSVARHNRDPMIAFAANQMALSSYIHAGRIDAAREACEAARFALDRLDPLRDNHVMMPLEQQPAWITHYAFAAWLHWLAGDEDRWREASREARHMCERTPVSYLVGSVATIEGIVWCMDETPAGVFDAQAWAASVSDGEVFAPVSSWLAVQHAWASGMTGAYDPMIAHGELVTALGDLTRAGAEVTHTLYWSLAAQLALAAEDHALALDMVHRGIARADVSGEHFWTSELERLRAVSLDRLGHRDESASALQRARHAAARTPSPPLVARLAPATAG